MNSNVSQAAAQAAAQVSEAAAQVSAEAAKVAVQEQAQSINPGHLFSIILSLCPRPNSQFMLNALTLS